MALGIIDNINKRNKLSKLVHFFSFFTPSEHAVTVFVRAAAPQGPSAINRSHVTVVAVKRLMALVEI